MREDAFRAYAAMKLKPNAVNSYLANCRHVERVIGQDLADIPLDEPDVRKILRRLSDRGTTPSRVSDCGSALRMYASFAAAGPTTIPKPLVKAPSQSSAAPAILPNLTQTRARDLLALHAAVIDEFRRRGIVRTSNGPIGDYAETLFARALGWTLEPSSAAGHDAVDPEGLRYQIKARRITADNPSRQLGAIRKLTEHPFDHLAAVLFDGKFDVMAAVVIPFDLIAKVAKPVAHTNSWRVMLSDGLISAPGVRDVTDLIRIAHRVI